MESGDVADTNKGDEVTDRTEPPKNEYTPMDLDDWAGKWKEGKSRWHKDHVHTLLEKHIDKLTGGGTDKKIFVPLCGKTVDMKWLSDRGHRVVGVESTEMPILEFFEESNIKYTKEQLSGIDGFVYKSEDGKIIIYQCDFFLFNTTLEANFDCVWDRGSFIAINKEDRERYLSVIKCLTLPGCRILLVIVKYDPNLHPGPPHLVPEDSIQALYGDEFQVEFIEYNDSLDDRWKEKGMTYFDEALHCITRKS